MALQIVLQTKASVPYSKLPPIQVNVVATKTQSKVLSWDFSEGSVTPMVTKENKIAVISDGNIITKIVLFEEFSERIIAGRNYLMRGYSLRGNSPPYTILITSKTQFMRSSPVAVPEDLKKEATALLDPPSRKIHLRDFGKVQGHMTVEGRVIESSAPKKILMRTEEIPLKNIKLQQEDTQVDVSLWREAALLEVDYGKEVSLSHLVFNKSSYGLRLQSTANTQLLTSVKQEDKVFKITGIIETGRNSLLEIATSDNEKFFIEESLWSPLEDLMFKSDLYVKAIIDGGKVTRIQPVDKP